MNPLILQAKELFAPLPVTWAVCGGFALDLFLGKETRSHSDLDICVFEQDRDALCTHLWRSHWHVFEFQGQGLLRPIYGNIVSKPGRNVMCVKSDCDLVTFHPCGDDDPRYSELYYYEFHYKGIVELNYLELLFNRIQDGAFVFSPQEDIRRELSKAILFREGVPYLAPELVLLFKSLRPEHSKYLADFENTAPYLSDGQRQWLRQAMGQLSPCNPPPFPL